MIKCKCYRIFEETKYLNDFQRGAIFALTGKWVTEERVEVARCYGTKEREICKCGGDRRKCDFYPPPTRQKWRGEKNEK